MPLRAQLKSVRILLEETPITPANAPGLVERLQELADRIEQLPLSAVRPATIALRNLMGTLRRPGLSSGLADELATAIEAIAALLADETFGIDSDEVRARIAAILKQRGATLCAVCKHAELAIEPVYLLLKPFPSEPTLAPSQLPYALVACKRCGVVRMHDLTLLGIL